MPDRLYRRCGAVALVVALATPLAILSSVPLGLDEEAFYGGWRLPALLTASLEGVGTITAPVWALGFAQRHLNRTGPLRRAMAWGSYAAFMLQGPVLVGLALLFRLTGLPVDLKALIVAALGIAGSFVLAWPLAARTPLRRIL